MLAVVFYSLQEMFVVFSYTCDLSLGGVGSFQLLGKVWSLNLTSLGDSHTLLECLLQVVGLPSCLPQGLQGGLHAGTFSHLFTG